MCFGSADTINTQSIHTLNVNWMCGPREINSICKPFSIQFKCGQAISVVYHALLIFNDINHIDCVHSLMLRKSGLSTDGDTDSVRLVGPIAPITYRGTPVTMDIWQYV